MLVKNLHPEFIPAQQSGTRPALIKDACKYIQQNQVYLWSGFRLWSSHNDRKRGFNLHLKKAIHAGMQALAHHANLLTGVVHASCTDMSDMCGLSTTGDSGKKSISRFTRMIDQLERYNLIKTDRIWDRAQGMWIPKLIQVQPLFWSVCGISEKRLQGEQRKALGRLRQQKKESGATPEQIATFGISEAEQEARKNFIKGAFKARRQDSERRAAKRKVQSLKDKSYSEQLDIYARDIISNATPAELAVLTPQELRRQSQYLRGKHLNQTLE
ncbi:plasmid replication initiator RepA [Vibrio scophthalmi]|uniref:plasmid replication initiator RepA n=1 Tax=Vibrio scophthalmi TaxID=45658 RepID=UPI0038739F59